VVIVHELMSGHTHRQTHRHRHRQWLFHVHR